MKTQLVSHRFLRLTRDNNLWKNICFDRSFNERRRLRQLDLGSTNSRYTALTRALERAMRRNANAHNPKTSNDDTQGYLKAAQERKKAFANWDPSYPDEKINYYEEYVQRHASISMSWFETVKDGIGEEKNVKEVTGMSMYYADDGERAEKLFGALDDGSIGVWQVSDSNDVTVPGRLVGRSLSGVLCQPLSQPIEQAKAIMTETGAVECVSIDNNTQRGYFAVQTMLSEVDLRTLSIISREWYPFPITAVSEAKYPTPITIGTNMSLHFHDPRSRRNISSLNRDVLRIERIGGHVSNDFQRLISGDIRQASASLPQPGPLSILHMPENRPRDYNGDIWVAGRFTHLLNYDRRKFPQVQGTISSGARISCLRIRPQPFIPRQLDQIRNQALSVASINETKSIPGCSLIATGEYKGKGSLEQYGLSSDPRYAMLSTDRNTVTCFKNRQTASTSKLLSVASHGGKLVYSDGDGNVKWIERDGFSPIRLWNLNDQRSTSADDNVLSDFLGVMTPTHVHGGFFGQPTAPPEDIVQQLLPTMPKSTLGHGSLTDDNLVIWTGEGKLGLLGFGKQKWDWSNLEEQALEYDEIKRRNEEREYAGMMRRALRRQQDELNFIRNFGLGI